MRARPASYPCLTCRRSIAKWNARCNACRGVREGAVIPGRLRRSNCYAKRDEVAYAARLREAERRRILRGDICRDCGEVCTGIEDCVSRIAAAIRRGRVVCRWWGVNTSVRYGAEGIAMSIGMAVAAEARHLAFVERGSMWNPTRVPGMNAARALAKFVVGIYVVTPDLAAELLKRNTRNRKISRSVVDKYIAEMKRGEWYPTASGIGFDVDGVLVDGQHRLMAIVESGVSVPMLVVEGLPSRSQEKVDRQRRRTIFDVFSLAGYKNNRIEIQTATFLASLTDDGTISTSVADCEVAAAIDAFRDSLAVVCAETRSKQKGVDSVGVRAAMVLAHAKHGDKAIEFLHRVRGEVHSSATDPAFRLRKVLLGETSGRYHRATGGGGYQVWSYRRTCFAFNAWLRGQQITYVREAAGIADVA